MNKSPILKLTFLLPAFAGLLAAESIPVEPLATTVGGIDTTGTIQTAVYYTVGGNTWMNLANGLNYQTASDLSGQGLEDPYLQALSNNLATGWTYAVANQNLTDGSLIVQTYDVQAPTPPATNSDAFALAAPSNPFSLNCVNNNNCVGEEFEVGYDQQVDDPSENIHWVQVLYTNLTGNPTWLIDNGGGTVPYYDFNGAADATDFLDLPGINRPGQQWFFDAEDYLVQGPDAADAGQFTILGAVDYGWANSPTPEPATFLTAGAGLVLIGLCRRKKG